MNLYGVTDSGEFVSNAIKRIPKENHVNKIKELFKYKKKLGEGASGKVLLAQQKFGDLTRRCALKELHRKHKVNAQLFLREVVILESLQHPNILELYITCYNNHNHMWFPKKLKMKLSHQCIHFILKLLERYPEQRSSAEAALKPPWIIIKEDEFTNDMDLCEDLKHGLQSVHAESKIAKVSGKVNYGQLSNNDLLDNEQLAIVYYYEHAKYLLHATEAIAPNQIHNPPITGDSYYYWDECFVSPQYHPLPAHNYSVSATIHSLFDCNLNPKRTELLLTRYCSMYGYYAMALDVISIIILFLNQSLYWKIDQIEKKQKSDDEIIYDFSCAITKQDLLNLLNSQSSDFQATFRHFNLANLLFRHFNSHFDEHEDMMKSYSFESYSYVANIYPNPNIINVMFTVRNRTNDIFIELNHNLSRIKLMTIRIRMFCVESEQEIVQILVVEPCEEYKICTYEELGIFAAAWNLNIGAEVEIVHILCRSGDYWSKCTYSLFSHIVDLRLSAKCINYHNARSFKINDKYYYLIDEQSCRRRLCAFVDFYANKFITLTHDIILLENKDGSQSQSLLLNYLKTSRFRIHLQFGELLDTFNSSYKARFKFIESFIYMRIIFQIWKTPKEQSAY